MAKKSKFSVSKICYCVAALLGIVAIILMVVPALKDINNSDVTYTGFQVAFGYTKQTKVVNSTVSVKVLDASAYILPLILVVLGMAASVIALLGKFEKIASLAAAVCFVGAGVTFFLATVLVAPHVEESGLGIIITKDDYIKTFKENVKLGAGAIVNGILAIVAALAAGIAPYIQKVIKK